MADKPGGNLTKFEIACFKEAFALIDTNKDGTIDEDELKSLGDALGQQWNPQEIKGLIEPFDPQQTDRIDFPNMLKQFQHKDNEDPLDMAQEAFDLINGGNPLDASSLQNFLATIGQNIIDDESKEMVKLIGSNGQVTYEQFAELWKNNDAFKKK